MKLLMYCHFIAPETSTYQCTLPDLEVISFCIGCWFHNQSCWSHHAV